MLLIIRQYHTFLPLSIFFLFLQWVQPSFVKAETVFSNQPITIRVGLTTYDGVGDLHRDRESTTNQKINRIKDYLLKLKDESEEPENFKFPQPLEFELYLGNYYQIYDWIQKGNLEAAIVPPVLSTILLENNQVDVVGEFPAGNAYFENLNSGKLLKPIDIKTRNFRGNWPLVSATKCVLKPSSSEEFCTNFKSNSKVKYDEVIKGIFKDSENFVVKTMSGNRNLKYCNKRNFQDIRFYMVSHLSASGFIVPLIYAKKFIYRNLLKYQNDERKKIIDKFWNCYLDKVRFNFDHNWKRRKVVEKRIADKHEGNEPPKDIKKITMKFYFTFSGRDDLIKQEWQPYFDTNKAAPPIPNDTFVIKKDLIREISGFSSSIGEETLRNWKTILLKEERKRREPPLQKDIQVSQNPKDGYRFFKKYDQVSQELFKRRVEDLFDLNKKFKKSETKERPFLLGKYKQWYLEGNYDFTTDEIFMLLNENQENSLEKHLSLVLPGSGVRSAYQSKLLDHLYATQKLVNVGSHIRAKNFSTKDQSMVVTDIVGTSGGALVGLISALRKPEGSPKNFISKNWDVIDSSDIFPRSGALFWLSSLIITIVFFLIILFIHWETSPLFIFNRSRGSPFTEKLNPSISFLFLRSSERIWPSSFSWISTVLRFGLLIWIPLGFILTHKIHNKWGIASPHIIEVIGFIFLIFLSHFCINFVIAEEKKVISNLSAEARRKKTVFRNILIFLFLLWISLLLGPPSSQGENEKHLFAIINRALNEPSFEIGFINALGVNCIVLFIIYLAKYNYFHLKILGSGESKTWYQVGFISSLLIILVHWGVSYLALFCILKFLKIPLIEITVAYWIWLITVASSCSILIYILGRWILKTKLQVKEYVRYGFGYLLEMEASSKWMIRPSHYLIVLSFLGFISWSILSATSIYGSENAIESFTKKVCSSVGYDKSQESPSNEKCAKGFFFLFWVTSESYSHYYSPGKHRGRGASH